MHSNACFALVLLCLAAAQAIPAGKIEKKSVSDEPTLETSDLKLEEAGDSKDRPKKSTFCVEIRPDGQDGQVQNGASSVQTLNLVPQAQLASQVQTYNLQPALQPVQTLSVMQAPQLAQQSIYVPQQMAPPVQTLQIIQSPQQPCSEPKMKIVQKETEFVPEPTSAPAPTTTTRPPCAERMQTMVNVEQQPQADTMNVMHMPRPYNEEIVVVPPKPVIMVSEPQRLATLVQIPGCPHHSNQVGQCTCRTQGYAAARAADMRTDPMHFARARPVGDGRVHMMGKHQHFY
ncbi:uncharacterized protein LOC143377120 [Andrena cerasifolii]|uniref:uncharacterized protein LOC143377120 n=1 Tax=Andrena cerasifolii TaxID=2819439 RepID=UPI00403793DE